MAAKSTRCSRCPNPETHLVRTKGGVHRTCTSCATDLVNTRGDVVAVNALPGTVAVAPPAKTEKVWDEAAEKLPDNEFAAAITGMLAEVAR